MKFPNTILIFVAICLLPSTSFADTAPAEPTSEENKLPDSPWPNILGKGNNEAPTSLEFGEQTIFYTEGSDSPLLKPDLNKNSSSFTLKPFKVFVGKKKSRALVKCNMSWQKMTKLSDNEKAQYQSGSEKSAIASINSPIDRPDKELGIPEPPGTIRDLTATFKTSQNGVYFLGSLTCKIREYIIDGKIQPLNKGEILAVLKKVGFEHKK